MDVVPSLYTSLGKPRAVVVMLAAETQTLNGMASSTPRRRGTDCKSSKKKLVQARLPFKRLNPEPKENQEHKRARPAPGPESSVSDGENEAEPSLLPVRHGPALVNGRGPLDGFMRRSSPSHTLVDLTGDESPVKLPAAPVFASSCLPEKGQHPSKDKPASTEIPSSKSHTAKKGASDCKVTNKPEQNENAEEVANVEEETGFASLLDTTQESESEEEEQDEDSESVKADVSSLGNTSILSPSSVSSLSATMSSPEQTKTNSMNSPTEPKTTPKIPADQKKVQRRSLKSPQEQEERNRQRQEKEREREEAKAAKEKKKEEARKLKEDREKEKREKKEKDEREKREKKEKEEKEKAEKLKAKEEQRKSKQEAKLEEKRKKEEEKKQKEEEKRLKEEKDRLKLESAAITRFLQKPKTQQAPKTLAAACGKFAPFELKDNMFLAPLCRVQCEDSVLEELDQYLLKPGEDLNGLEEWIRKKSSRPRPTNPRQRDYLSNCMVVEGTNTDGVPDRKHYGPMKLLKFHENYRPAYWGTWSKKSAHISPRCPLRQDKTLLDYEVESDEEWEEEEPGESLSHSEGEDEEEGGANNGANDDDDDDGFFVPHGYLSDGEGALEEEEGAGDLEKQKVRQKLKAREWDELMSCKKKVKVLEAVVRGCVWEGQSDGSALEFFQPFAMCLIEPLPKADTTPSPEQAASNRQGDEQLVRQLLPLLHGNFNSTKVIITEFQEFCRQQSSSSSESSSSSPPNISSPLSSADIPSRLRLKRLIQSNAVYEKRSTHRFRCWYVHADVLARYGQETLPVPCQWNYLTSGAREELREEPQAATGSHGNSPTTPQASSTMPSSSKRKSVGSMSITKFMKKCTTDSEQAMETDGFQADTEDGDEDDCIVVAIQRGSCTGNKTSSNPSTSTTTEGEASEQMEVTASDNAALPLTSPAPTIATA